MQVKLVTDSEEKRFSLPEQFVKAVGDAQMEGDNVVLLRKWKEQGARYGELDEIGESVVEELIAAYPKERIDSLVNKAKNPENTEERAGKEGKRVSLEDFDAPDWQTRYQLLESMRDPGIDDLPLLEKAMNDEKASIRRLAVVYVGMIEDKQVLPLLYKGLTDKTVTVRRTAGDCLSDLGFEDAMEEMAEALQDKSKLVRWRAAMFLYEVGDKSVLPALKKAEDDPEFEVKLQVRMAIERIEGGEAAKGSVWKQMTEARKQ